MMVNDISEGVVNSSEEKLCCPVCQKLADKVCSGCHNISYCSLDHQKRHWKVHKKDCRIFTIKRNELYGRFLVATRDIPQGTIIFTEEPITVGPKRGGFPVCLGCYKRVDGSYRCSKCTYPMCSLDCEQEPMHAANECVVFQRGAPVGAKITNFTSICPAYECITPIRCLMLKHQNPSKWERLITMEHHNELRKTVPSLWNRNCVNVVKLLLEWYKMKDELDEDTIHSVLGYIDVNCFEIKYKDAELVGIFRDAGLMCHDCLPNTHNAITMSADHKIFVRSSVPIKKGEMITTSYANRLTGTRERRSFIKDTKYFDCFCRRCSDPTEFATYISSVKCMDCATGYLLPKDSLGTSSTDWVCTNTNNNETINDGKGNLSCTKTLKDDQVQTILRKVSKDIDEVTRSSSGSQISRLERLLKKYSGRVLHPNHYLLINVIRDLNYAYAQLNNSQGSGFKPAKDELDLDRLNRSKVLCLQLLNILDMIDPGLTRLRGVILYQLSLSDFQFAQVRFDKKEMSMQDYRGNLEKIITYLRTAKEIIELDKLVTISAVLYGNICEQLDAIQLIITSPI